MLRDGTFKRDRFQAEQIGACLPIGEPASSKYLPIKAIVWASLYPIGRRVCQSVSRAIDYVISTLGRNNKAIVY